MLKNSHEKVKQLIYLYFYIFEMQFIPSVRFRIIDEGKLLVFPIIYFFSAFCNIWHFVYEVKSLENILELAVITNIMIAAIEIIFTTTIVNLGFKRHHLRVQRYFENIVESSDEFMSKARDIHLCTILEIAAYKAVRFFSTCFVITGQLFPVTSLVQTNFVSPTYYRIPGIPPSSVFLYPVNIIVQFFFYWCIIIAYIAIPCLFLIYLFYFRGEIYSIAAVSELLTHKENLSLKCPRILRSIYEAHRELMQEFRYFSQVMWHFCCHRFFTVILLTCSSSFSCLQANSIVIGMILLTLAISLFVILCVPGQLIDNCSEDLQGTLYECLWYEMSLKDQRNFLLILNGAQRSMKVETIGIEKISFSTLVQGITTAISYIAFVYTVLF
ncbi:hypothetical protein DMENIID0001_054560 [Sergentomyia squamirostris]